MRELARHHSKPKIHDALARVIQRADELTEFVSIYWADAKTKDARARNPLSKQVKLGLAQAFTKFNAYALAKYNRDGAVKLKDVLFMCHAKPVDEEQAVLWKHLIAGTLAAPDTWEVALSAGADKGETFTRLLTEKKLGSLALLRNLRNMQESGVDKALVREALLIDAPKTKALPFRYIAAARACPAWEPMLDEAMQASMAGMEKMTGRTVVLVDVSGSMLSPLSAKSDLTRIDAACALAILVRGVCEDVRVFMFTTSIGEAAPRHGMALADAIRSFPSGGTMLGAAISYVNKVGYDRLIVVTDEESQDKVGGPIAKGYIINVATGQHGVGYGEWTKITGFSEAVVSYIQACEKPAQ
jgi:60 kDa SS-A/Ro ribonucleoprotein